MAGLSFALPASAQTPATGAIEGRVFDPRRGEYLEDARLTIEGTTLTTLSDNTGGYRLAGVPAGTAKLQVFCTGLGTQTELVAVAPSQTVQRDITLGGTGRRASDPGAVVRLDQFVISSSREMDGAAVASSATISIEPGTSNYRPKRLDIDVTGEFFLRRNLGLFFALRNVGGATEDTKIYDPNPPRYARFRQRDDYASLWTAGLKGFF